jgi:hypothetical protein
LRTEDSGKERGQQGRELGRRLLSDVVTAVDGLAADIVRPVAPDSERVAAVVFQIVPLGPQEQQRTIDPAASGAVSAVIASAICAIR